MRSIGFLKPDTLQSMKSPQGLMSKFWACSLHLSQCLAPLDSEQGGHSAFELLSVAVGPCGQTGPSLDVTGDVTAEHSAERFWPAEAGVGGGTKGSKHLELCSRMPSRCGPFPHPASTTLNKSQGPTVYVHTWQLACTAHIPTLFALTQHLSKGTEVARGAWPTSSVVRCPRATL